MTGRTLLLLAALAPAVASAQAATAASAASFDPIEFKVPWGADTRPRDPYADPQGRVWFVGQVGNYVGYVDSRSGEFKQYAIDPGTNPHNLVVEKGMVWFTGNRNNRIVRLDPATGKLTTFMIPDSTVRDPHTMVFDPRSGVAWFTAQNAGTVGRFDPATGQFRLWKTGPRSRPYGIVLDSRGRPWFDLFGTNKIAMIDPATMAVKEYVIPSDSARPRRIAITSDDQVYWGDYTRGFLGHLDPATGKMQEWRMPGGAISLPYGMATDDRNVIWLAEGGRPGVPTKLVAFDPRKKAFIAEIPVGTPGGNTIRHMTFDKATRQLWFATDQGTVGRIKVPPIAVVP